MVPIFIIDSVYLLSSHISYVYVCELCKSDHVGSKKGDEKGLHCLVASSEANIINFISLQLNLHKLREPNMGSWLQL